ncbi:MAG: hypothetical protein Kow0098_17160 [Ignavibacteriaceae bacterium]
MRIIRLIKKNNNVLVQLDTDEQLILNYELVVRESLRKNDELSQDKIDFLIQENQKFNIRQRALNLLARRLHSSGEIRTKLRSKGFEKHLVDSVVDQLSESNLIDDRRFARAFIDEKRRIRNWSINRIRKELYKRGIRQDIIKAILTDVETDDTEKEHAFNIAIRKYKLLSQRFTDQRKIRQKLIASLLAKGFDFAICKEVTDTILGEAENDTQLE